MKKSHYLIVLLSLFLISWGRTGHNVTGRIAENHLTPQAKTAVYALLGGQALPEVASWADELRNDPQYKGTASWHFINLPLGLSRSAFEAKLQGLDPDNAYGAILKCEADLKDVNTTAQQKTDALKFLVHFVGDIHQPMHVSRAEDKGGNTIQVNYEGKGTNLHSLWDTKLLEHESVDPVQLTSLSDKATDKEIKQWQSDPVIQWAWESYQISSKLYAEIDAMPNKTITEDYYQNHIAIVNQRLEQAGIRLAGLLNGLFSNYQASQVKRIQPMEAVPTIKIEEAAKHYGETVKICAKVSGHRDLGSFALVNMGGEYPDQLLTLMLRGELKKLADHVDGQLICVTGKVINYKDKPEIIVTDEKQIEN